MWALVRRLVRRPPQEAVVLNLALDLAQDWGSDFGKPVVPRLRARYPWLSERQLQGVEDTVQAAKTAAHASVARLERVGGKMPDFRAFRRDFGPGHAWVNRANLHRLYAQSCYFASK